MVQHNRGNVSGTTTIVLELERLGVDVDVRSLLQIVAPDLSALKAMDDGDEVFGSIVEEQMLVSRCRRFDHCSLRARSMPQLHEGRAKGVCRQIVKSA